MSIVRAALLDVSFQFPSRSILQPVGCFTHSSHTSVGLLGFARVVLMPNRKFRRKKNKEQTDQIQRCVAPATCSVKMPTCIKSQNNEIYISPIYIMSFIWSGMPYCCHSTKFSPHPSHHPCVKVLAFYLDPVFSLHFTLLFLKYWVLLFGRDFVVAKQQ